MKLTTRQQSSPSIQPVHLISYIHTYIHCIHHDNNLAGIYYNEICVHIGRTKTFGTTTFVAV